MPIGYARMSVDIDFGDPTVYEVLGLIAGFNSENKLY